MDSKLRLDRSYLSYSYYLGKSVRASELVLGELILGFNSDVLTDELDGSSMFMSLSICNSSSISWFSDLRIK